MVFVYRQARLENAVEDTLHGRRIVYQQQAWQMADAQVRGKSVNIMNGATGTENN